MKTKLLQLSLLMFIGTFFISGCKKKKEVSGCMDKTSLNYNPNATKDDGSCKYAPQPSQLCFIHNTAGTSYSINNACTNSSYPITSFTLSLLAGVGYNYELKAYSNTSLIVDLFFQLDADIKTKTSPGPTASGNYYVIPFNSTSNYLLYSELPFGNWDTRTAGGSGSLYYYYSTTQGNGYVRGLFYATFPDGSTLKTNMNLNDLPFSMNY